MASISVRRPGPGGRRGGLPRSGRRSRILARRGRCQALRSSRPRPSCRPGWSGRKARISPSPIRQAHALALAREDRALDERRVAICSRYSAAAFASKASPSVRRYSSIWRCRMRSTSRQSNCRPPTRTATWGPALPKPSRPRPRGRTRRSPPDHDQDREHPALAAPQAFEHPNPPGSPARGFGAGLGARGYEGSSRRATAHSLRGCLAGSPVIASTCPGEAAEHFGNPHTWTDVDCGDPAASRGSPSRALEAHPRMVLERPRDRPRHREHAGVRRGQGHRGHGAERRRRGEGRPRSPTRCGRSARRRRRCSAGRPATSSPSGR